MELKDGRIIEDLIITEHAKKRFAERIMEKDSALDINKFISEHQLEIQERIEKMIKFGTSIYKGKLRDYNITEIFINGSWAIILDKDLRKVITLYKIDLGCSEELNEAYVSEMMNKILLTKEQYEEKKQQNQENNQQLSNSIKDYQNKIKELKKMINDYQKCIDGMDMIISNNAVELSFIDQEFRNLVEKLVCVRTA